MSERPPWRALDAIAQAQNDRPRPPAIAMRIEALIEAEALTMDEIRVCLTWRRNGPLTPFGVARVRRAIVVVRALRREIERLS